MEVVNRLFSRAFVLRCSFGAYFSRVSRLFFTKIYLLLTINALFVGALLITVIWCNARWLFTPQELFISYSKMITRARRMSVN